MLTIIDNSVVVESSTIEVQCPLTGSTYFEFEAADGESYYFADENDMLRHKLLKYLSSLRQHASYAVDSNHVATFRNHVPTFVVT